MENIEKAPNVPPFVRYCAMLVPTVFDDSLSYYEALCALSNWVQNNLVDVVNNNAEVTEEYIQLTKDLQSYVEHYFENLDVQEEINNKLDEMVANGTFQAILDTYVTGQIQALDDKFTGMISEETNSRTTADASLQSQINSLASGSPIAVTSTSDMTDTSKVYGVFCRMTSSAPRGYLSCIHNIRLTADLWLIFAPLGLPVEPEV